MTESTRPDVSATEITSAIYDLLHKFTSLEATSDGKVDLVVFDHMFLDEEFFPRLFEILGGKHGRAAIDSDAEAQS